MATTDGLPRATTHLVGQLAGVAQHDGRHLALLGIQLLQHGQHEDRGLAHAGLGLAQDVHAQDGMGDALMLDCRAGRATLRQVSQECRGLTQGVERG